MKYTRHMSTPKASSVPKRSFRRDLAMLQEHLGSCTASEPADTASLFTTIQRLPLARELDALKSGLPSISWTLLGDLGLSQTEIAAVVGASSKTIQRKENSKRALDLVESDRTMRLFKIIAESVDAIGDMERAIRWLRSPLRYLGDKSPLELLSTEAGTQLVRQSLAAIAYGGVA